MNNGKTSSVSWLAPLATAFSIVACYGTLAVIGLLSALGITISLHEGVWAGTISIFAVLALAGIALGWRVHRKVVPCLVGTAGTSLILWAMAVSYSRSVEIAGFILLVAGAALDWRTRRN